MRIRYLAINMLIASLSPTLLFAQTSTTSTPGGTDSAATGGLEEIVITAQRTTETSQRAAIAISTVSGQALRDAGVSKPEDLTTIVPSLQIAPAAGPYAIFYLRGVGNFSSNALSDSAVAFNTDGVFVGRPSSTSGYFYDVSRIEVLKGPQGTLYGRNATGGAINVITNKPELGSLYGDVGLEYGNYNAVRVDGDVNAPISDIAAVRVAGFFVKHSGYMKDGTDDQNDLGGRVSFLLQPNADLTITTVADYFRQRGHGIGDEPIGLNLNDRQGALSAAGAAFLATQPNTLLGRTFAPLGIQPFLHNENYGISSTIDWKSAVGDFTLIPAYRRTALDYVSDAPGFYLAQVEHDRQASVEARYATSKDFPVQFLLGGFYYNERNDLPQYGIAQQANFNFQEYETTTKSKAVFTRLTYAVVPDVKLSVGARYTKDDKDFEGVLLSASRICVLPTSYFPTYVPGCPTATPIPNGFTPPAPNFVPGADGTITTAGIVDESGANARSASFSRVTYRGGIDWDVTSKNLLYFSYETGFKAGGFFFSADSGVYQPEKIGAYTLGSKNRFLDNRLQVNLEAFYWLYKNQQISHLGFDSAGDIVFPTENVGKASFKGLEVDSQFLATENTLLTTDIQYLDAKYDSFVYSTPNLNGGTANGTSCATEGTPGLSYTVNCSGKQPPNAPTWTMNLSAQQTVPLNNGAKVVGAIRGHFQTQSLTGLEFLSDEYQHSYWLADAQLSYVPMGERFRVSGFVDNMFDKTVIAQTFPTPFSFFRSSTLRPPRTFGIRVQAHF